MASLTPSEVTQYHSQGFVVPQYRLSTEWVARLQLALDSLIKNNPGVRPEKLVSAHLQGQSQAGINDEGVRGSQDFLDLAMHPDIVDLVTHVMGKLACLLALPPGLCGCCGVKTKRDKMISTQAIVLSQNKTCSK